MMTYDEALEYLNAPQYAKTRPGLEPVRNLLNLLGNPQDQMKYIHITGTNGKGSTAAYIERILREAGYRTGLYTSPFLEHFTERIQVSGKEIPREDLARLTETVKGAVDMMKSAGMILPTIFEMVTAVGFLYFLEQACDLVVLEVGLGGRLDATNIIAGSEVAVITTIDYDHMDLLGDTLAEIAYEKGGIIKKKGTVVSYPQRKETEEVLCRRCREQQARLIFADLKEVSMVRWDIEGQCFSLPGYGELELTLLGRHQVNNAVIAITVAEQLREKGYHVSPRDIAQGLKKTRWKGRLEPVCRKPLILIDGAHNPNGVRGLYCSLCELFPNRKIVFIAGVLADKNYSEMFQIMKPLIKCVLTVTPSCTRALPGQELAEILRKDGLEAVYCDSAQTAVSVCQSRFSEEIICAFGSLYYIGDIRRCFAESPGDNDESEK